MTKSKTEAAELLSQTGFLRHYISVIQRRVLTDMLKGEEFAYFAEVICDLAARIRAMPKSYETDNEGMEAKVHLHYFRGGVDAWVSELDSGRPDDSDPGQQRQAFGMVSLTGDKSDAELGYISIEELIDAGMELDLHWTVIAMKDLK